MFARDIEKRLSEGAEGSTRKPLLLRGARQVGKTFAVRLYAGALDRRSVRTPSGTPYELLSLPYYLAAKLPECLDWLNSGGRPRSEDGY